MDKRIMIKILILCLFLVSCTGLKMKEVVSIEQIRGVNKLEDGTCEYLVQPRPNQMIYINNVCGYHVGQRIEYLQYLPDENQ